jgi:hypothetical protein
VLPGATLRAMSCKQVVSSLRTARLLSCRVCSDDAPKASMWIKRVRNEIGVSLGEAGGNRGEETGAIRGEPLIGRYLGVEDPVVGLNKGDDGRDRTPPPEPLTPGLLSRTDKKARELDEL